MQNGASWPRSLVYVESRQGQTFNNWLSTRHATQLSDQDAELVSRTRALDGLKDRKRAAGAAVEAQQQAALDARQSTVRERRKLAEM